MHRLEPDASARAVLTAAVVARTERFLEALADAPASNLDHVLARLGELELDRPPPAAGRELDELLDAVMAGAELGLNTAGPGYLAFIPGGGLYTAAVADFLACVTNRFVNLAAPAPALVQLEVSVLRWLADLFSFPRTSQAILTSGGSIANLTALVAAREQHLGRDIARGVVYLSDQAHGSNARAARLAGLHDGQLRIVATDRDLRLDLDALAASIAADRSDGLLPFMVVASAGATNTGTIDPLTRIADLAQREGMWFHADAAYGGFFQLTARGRARMAGIERADSITLDPHKGLFLPYGTGALLVRDADVLRRSLDVGGAHYLQDLTTEWGLPDLVDYSPELSRDFRGLRMWLPLHLHGVDAFRDALDEKLDLADRVRAALVGEAAFEVIGDPDLSTVAFRLRAGNDASVELLARVNAERRVLMSSTSIGGSFIVRVCVLSFRTHVDRIDEAIESIVRHGRELDRQRMDA